MKNLEMRKMKPTKFRVPNPKEGADFPISC